MCTNIRTSAHHMIDTHDGERAAPTGANRTSWRERSRKRQNTVAIPCCSQNAARVAAIHRLGGFHQIGGHCEQIGSCASAIADNNDPQSPRILAKPRRDSLKLQPTWHACGSVEDFQNGRRDKHRNSVIAYTFAVQCVSRTAWPDSCRDAANTGLPRRSEGILSTGWGQHIGPAVRTTNCIPTCTPLCFGARECRAGNLR